jgi:arylsulfatase
VQVAEGVKGGETRQWGNNSYENYLKIDPEAQRRTLEFIERQAKAGKPFYVANWPMMFSCRSRTTSCSASGHPIPAPMC